VRVSLAEQDEILKSHLIEPRFLRIDDFANFFCTQGGIAGNHL